MDTSRNRTEMLVFVVMKVSRNYLDGGLGTHICHESYVKYKVRFRAIRRTVLLCNADRGLQQEIEPLSRCVCLV